MSKFKKLLQRQELEWKAHVRGRSLQVHYNSGGHHGLVKRPFSLPRGIGFNAVRAAVAVAVYYLSYAVSGKLLSMANPYGGFVNAPAPFLFHGMDQADTGAA